MAGQLAEFRTDADALLRELDAVAGDLLREAEEHLANFGGLAVERMQAYCPTGQDGKHELLESIDSKPGRDDRGPYVDVGTFGVFYSLFVEMGTSEMDAQPFIRPGLEEAIAAWGNL